MKCWWIFFHEWSKWDPPTFGGQDRRCLKCGKAGSRLVW